MRARSVYGAAVPHDPDAPAVWGRELLSRIDLSGLYDPWTGVSNTSQRTKIRYLAALWPDLPMLDLSVRVHRAVGARGLPVSDVRLILEGRSLRDPSHRDATAIPVEAIQTVGRLLARGEALTSIARASGLHVDTVSRIEDFLGIRRAWSDQLLDRAIDAVRDGVSVRVFGREVGVSKSEAHRQMQKARSVLNELGEL